MSKIPNSKPIHLDKTEPKLTLLNDQPVKLGKSCMAFKTKGGEVLLIDETDIEVIGRKIFLFLQLNYPQYTLITRDVSLERTQALYQLYAKEKSEMTPEVKNEWLKKILELGSKEDYGFDSFLKKLEEDKPQ